MTPTAQHIAPATAGQRFVRGLGWFFIVLGSVLLLYLVWLLFLTGGTTNAAQEELLEEFGFGTVDLDEGGTGAVDGSENDLAIGDADGAEGDAPDVGSGQFVLEFERPGEADPVNDEPLVVVYGTDADALRLGPGHYPESADPGETGNVVVVGHRTTYGAPFYDIDDILPGDLVHLTTRDGERFTYEVMQHDETVSPGVRIIGKSELWVLGSDPQNLGPGRYLTLISCHPRFSSAQRIVSFLELVG